MQRKIARNLALLACLTWLALPATARAQGSAKNPPSAEQGEAATDKADDAPEFDPAQTPLVAVPKTAEELFGATLRMVSIKRLDLAKYYFDQLAALNLNDAALVELRAAFGVTPFMQLTLVPELRDAATALLDSSNAAVIAHVHSAEVLKGLLNRLQGTPAEQALAFAEIKALGTEAVPALLAALSHGEMADLHEAAQEALLLVGERAVLQLHAALQAPEEPVRIAAINVLGGLRSSTSLPHLWGPALIADEASPERRAAREAIGRILGVPASRGSEVRFSRNDGLKRLTDSVRQHLRLAHRWPLEPDGKVTYWHWNTQRQTVQSQRLTAAGASNATGLKLAQQAFALAPNNSSAEANVVAMAMMLAAAFDQPDGAHAARQVLSTQEAGGLVQVTRELLEAGRARAAAGCLSALEARVEQKKPTNDDRALQAMAVAALDDPHPTVQFAAASLLVALSPDQPYRGSTRVEQILTRAAASGSARRAIVAEVSAERGGRVAGYLAELGFDPLLVTSGRDAFLRAVERTDVELIVLHPGIIRWPLSETLANLRADSRTRLIPVVIHGPADLRIRMERLEQRISRLAFASLSLSTEDFEWQVRDVLEQIQTTAVPPAERAWQREQAQAKLATLQERRSR